MRRSPIARRSILAVSVATLALAGCGSGAAGSGAIGLTGTAADGYLDNATVCLDLNLNGQCDTNEPTTTTGPGGQWTLDATAQQEQNAPVLVKATAGSTVDEDTGNAVAKDYALYAPAGYKNVNPVTSLVYQQAVKQGLIAPDSQQDISTVEQDVAQKVFGSADAAALLKDDYVKGEQDASQPADQAKFKEAHDLAKAIAATVSGALAKTDPNVVSNAGEGAVTLAAYQHVLNNLKVLQNIPAGSTEQEIESKTQSLQVAITSTDAESEMPDFSGSLVSYTALPGLPDAPTGYTAFQGKVTSAALSLDEHPYSLTLNKDGSATLDAAAPEHLSSAGGALTTTATSAPLVYNWSAAAGKLVAFQAPATLLSWDTSGAATYAGAIGAKVSITRVVVDGKDISTTAQRYLDQDWTDGSLGAATAFPANSAIYIVRAYSTAPVLTVLGGGSTSSGCTSGTGACAPLVTTTAQTVAGVTGQMLDIGVETDTYGKTNSVFEDATGILYLVDQSSATPTLVKIGSATTLAATATLPAMTLLSLQEDSTQYGSVDWADPRIGEEGTPALFSDAQGEHLGMYQPQGGRLYRTTLFDDTARDAVTGDITATLQ